VTVTVDRATVTVTGPQLAGQLPDPDPEPEPDPEPDPDPDPEPVTPALALATVMYLVEVAES